MNQSDLRELGGSVAVKCPVSGQTEIEEQWNVVTHALGFFLSILGFAYLAVQAQLVGSVLLQMGCIIYGCCLVAVYGASTIYHYSQAHQNKSFLRLLDHACIYLMIAGTYTPLTLGPLRGAFGWTIFSIIWIAAVVGISLKFLFTIERDLVSSIPYMLMGWLGVAVIIPLSDALPSEALYWLVAGGVTYTAGAIFYLLDRIPFNHVVWHLFVLGGSACHYVMIVGYVIVPISV